MNQKELREIRRRFKLEMDSISNIYGCYVNAAKEIVSRIDMPVGLMEQEEAEMYFKILKKSVSGTLGKNLMDIEFSTKQVEDSDEHRLLQGLRLSHLRDENLRELMYERIIETLSFEEESYVILMASDAYDVPFKGKDDDLWDDGSEEVFDYFVCCVCPVKDAKATLRYLAEEKSFRSSSTGHVLGTPELGFMYPAFDNRSANIYNLLYYSRSTSEIHEEFIKGIFNVEKIPMSAGEQKITFGNALTDALGEQCSLEVIKAVHEDIKEKILIHKESKEPELPEIYVQEVEEVLKEKGVTDEKIQEFGEICRKGFGDSSILNPANLIDTKKFEVSTTAAKITVDPEYVYSIETREIDGRQYIMIPVGEGVEINGIDIHCSNNLESEGEKEC